MMRFFLYVAAVLGAVTRPGAADRCTSSSKGYTSYGIKESTRKLYEVSERITAVQAESNMGLDGLEIWYGNTSVYLGPKNPSNSDPERKPRVNLTGDEYITGAVFCHNTHPAHGFLQQFVFMTNRFQRIGPYGFGRCAGSMEELFLHGKGKPLAFIEVWHKNSSGPGQYGIRGIKLYFCTRSPKWSNWSQWRQALNNVEYRTRVCRRRDNDSCGGDRNIEFRVKTKNNASTTPPPTKATAIPPKKLTQQNNKLPEDNAASRASIILFIVGGALICLVAIVVVFLLAWQRKMVKRRRHELVRNEVVPNVDDFAMFNNIALES